MVPLHSSLHDRARLEIITRIKKEKYCRVQLKCVLPLYSAELYCAEYNLRCRHCGVNGKGEMKRDRHSDINRIVARDSWSQRWVPKGVHSVRSTTKLDSDGASK